MKTIKAGTVCFISTLGHNGFWYPIYSHIGMTKVVEDIENPKIKSWSCGRHELMAIETNVEKVKDLYGDPLHKTIIWVDRKSIQTGE